MSFRRLLIVALVALAGAVTIPAVAWADGPQLSLPTEGIDWAAGTVTVSAQYPAGTKSVVFLANGQWLASVEVADPTLAGTVSSGARFNLTSATVFSAEAFDAQATLLGTTAPLVLDPATFAPSAPALTLAADAVVEPSFTLEASSDRIVTTVTVETGPEPLAHRPTLVSDTGDRIVVSGVRVPYGPGWIRLTAKNGFGSASSAVKSIFNLGPRIRLPKRAHYVLVDKRSMTLYDVRGRRVVRHYDIAVGTPSTPTPDGYFTIGAARPATGPWGVLRWPLYKVSGSQHKPSGFYIHGTDAPWSIGTWASHGCVRLYNWEIRNFSKTVPNGTLVLIR